MSQINSTFRKGSFIVDLEQTLSGLEEFFEENFRVYCHIGNESLLPVPYLAGFSGRNSHALYKTYVRLMDAGIGRFWLNLVKNTKFVPKILNQYFDLLMADDLPVFEVYRHLVHKVRLKEEEITTRAQFVIIFYVLLVGFVISFAIIAIELCKNISSHFFWVKVVEKCLMSDKVKQIHLKQNFSIRRCPKLRTRVNFTK